MLTCGNQPAIDARRRSSTPITPLTYARCLTSTASEIIKLGSSHTPPPQNLQPFQAWRVEREGTFHPNGMGNPTNGEIGTRSSPLRADNYSLERLYSLSLTFHNSKSYTNCIALLELCNFRVCFVLNKCFKIHVDNLRPQYNQVTV